LINKIWTCCNTEIIFVGKGKEVEWKVMTRSFYWPLAVLALLLLAFHVLEVRLLNAGVTDLGAVTVDHVPPLYAKPSVHLGLWLLPAVIVLGLFVWVARRVYLLNSVRVSWMLGLSVVLFVVIGWSVSLIDQEGVPGHHSQWAFMKPYERTGLEYIGAVPLVQKQGVRAFLHRYSEPGDVSDIPLHVMTHPPGGVLFLWLVRMLFGSSVWAAALSTILFTGLAIPAVWWLGRSLYGELAGRCAVSLFMLVPSVVMYTATSMDGPFAVFPAYSLAFFFAALKVWRPWLAVGSGIALALALFMTYSTVFLPLLFCVTVGLTILFEPERRLQSIKVLACVGGVSLGIFVLLYLFDIFNLLLAVKNSIRADHIIMGSLPMTPVRYLNHSIGNLTAFLIGMGLPVVVLWFIGNMVILRQTASNKNVDIFHMAFFLSLIIITFSTLYTLETERIWLFMAPLMVIPAARQLLVMRQQGSISVYAVCLILLCLQLVLSEALLYTYW
jgi:hypothetical protein